MTEMTKSEKALEAMKRAAETARQRAARFQSHLVGWADGRVIFIDPNAAIAEQDGAANPIPSKVGKSDGYP